MRVKEYRFPLNGASASDLQAVKVIIESNAGKFDNFLLSDLGGDTRYSVVDGSFEVTSIADGFFEYTAEINFYAGCQDMNNTNSEDGTMKYKIERGEIVIELDETVWNVR